MLKRIAIPVLALAALLIFVNPPQASAAVRFGVFLGGPAYPAPVYPAYPYAYSTPAPYYAPGPYDYSYPYAAPTYIYPSPGFGFGWVGHDHDRYEHYDRGYYRGGGHEFHGGGDHGRGGHR